MTVLEFKLKMLEKSGAVKTEYGWKLNGWSIKDEEVEILSSEYISNWIKMCKGEITFRQLEEIEADEKDMIQHKMFLKRWHNEHSSKVHPFFIAQIKPNTKDFEKITGYDIYFMASVKEGTAVVGNPIEWDNYEQYWKEQFEVLKDIISDDFKYFLEVMLSGSECMVSNIEIDKLMNFRYVTEEDAEKLNDNFEHMIEKYELDRKKIMEMLEW